MATPPLSEAIARDTVERVEAALRAGFRPRGMTGHGNGAMREAADQAIRDGVVRSRANFLTRVERARDLYGMEPDWSLWRPARYQQPVPLAVVHTPPPEPSAALPTGRAERVLAIGDLHQDPRLPHRLDVLTWIARYASDHQVPRIIQIGDWSTWDSVNQHDKNDTYAAKSKPSIRDDMENLKASLKAFHNGLSYKPKLHITLGNHENRLERFENMNPESHGVFTMARDEAFMQWGWKTRPYGEILYVQGVGFTHHPINGAGRAFGGKTGPQRAANESTIPMVSGHTHRRQVHDAPKIGPVESISMVEIGCAMPWGEVEGYAKHSLTGWWWGICDLTVQDGAITDVSFISMLTLERLYGERQAAA